MSAWVIFALLASFLLGLAIRTVELHYLRACLVNANLRTAAVYRKAAVLLARNNELELENAALIFPAPKIEP